MANKEYFRIIETSYPKIEDVRNIHEQKLNNYKKYKQPWTNADINAMPTIAEGYVPNFEIHHVNTSLVHNGSFFIMATILCCEDEASEEKGEKGEYR